MIHIHGLLARSAAMPTPFAPLWSAKIVATISLWDTIM